MVRTSHMESKTSRESNSSRSLELKDSIRLFGSAGDWVHQFVIP